MKRQQLAAALDMDVRTLQRYLGRGMPAPKDGESLQDWVTRASTWRAENKKAPGPKKSTQSEKRELLELEILEVKLARLRLEYDLQRGDVHPKKQCALQQEQDYQLVAAALLPLGGRLARKCYQAASPDVIQGIIDEEVRRCLAIISAGEDPSSGAARGSQAS